MNTLPALTYDDVSSELRLIKEIEKYPYIYNFTLPEYSRKELIKKAWDEISDVTKTSVHDCKEKWRNIRSSFLRSLKAPPKGSKPKKPYYMKRHLHFIIPFVKPMKNTAMRPSEVEESAVDVDVESSTLPSEPEEPQRLNDYSEVMVKVEEESEPEIDDPLTFPPDDGEESSTAASVYATTELGPEESPHRSATLFRRRKRRPVVLEKGINDLKTKLRKLETSVSALQPGPSQGPAFGDRNGMRFFLMSLLPELETMPEEQVRTFKIKVLMLIDEMKTSHKQQAS